ncbi:hypothetical protein AVEN_189309-1 [Araneus ventricosus]|uniref:Uncharacterized protein n=1 Tax=Araneus ventricosus TaxID=182803 RepID=A0A4Y2SVM2_ARAVE|nr:hypothetical protein AVEN_259413-1 [Araneus ventricosus]GBN91632.1 hypothetical protein AVEN_189309-1 [Araneus ventricosus]
MAFFPDKAASPRNASDDDLLLRQMTSLGCPPEDLGYHTLPPDDDAQLLQATWGSGCNKTEPAPPCTEATEKLVATFKVSTCRIFRQAPPAQRLSLIL